MFRINIHRLARGGLASLLVLAVAGCDNETMAVQSNDIAHQAPDDMIERAETLHPAEIYQLAVKLLGVEGRTDDAVKWFYIGQLRYRFHLAATEQPSGSNDRVLFSALSESVGRPINEYAFGDVDAAVAQINAALLWDATHDNRFTSKTRYPDELAEVRKGLESLRDDMLENKEEIRRKRAENGLPNR